MSANKSTVYYSLADVICSVGPCAGVPAIELSGYASGGGLEFSPNSDLHSMQVGADGGVSISENNDEVVMCTITLKGTVKAYRRLARMAQAQHDAKGLPVCPFLMVDPHLGDEVEESEGVFQDIPDLKKETESTERALTMILPHARPQLKFGSEL